MHGSNSSSVVQMHKARSTPGGGHLRGSPACGHCSSGKLRWQCESTYMPGRSQAALAGASGSERLRRLGRRDGGAQHLFDASFSWRDFSSFGKRTPTPWVRPPEALAGVIQATLPATGKRCGSSGSDSSR
jgi:hypothetical protein